MEGNIRTYKVLQFRGDGLIVCGDYVAGDDRSAVRQAIKDHGFAHFVAVPETNWHEHNPAPDPEPRIKWGSN